MCTLITVDRTYFFANKPAVISQIIQDSRLNSDGWSLVCVDPMALYGDISISAMNIGIILNTIENFMMNTSEYGRIFLHSRAATTDFVGVAFNHGFTDSKGTIIQHNGVVYNHRDLGVDSFNLVDYRTNDAVLFLDDLETANETWANVFLIRPTLNTYGVIHTMGGTLYQDHKGNYSTNRLNGIKYPTTIGFAKEHNIRPVPKSSATPVTAKSTTPDSAFDPYGEYDNTPWDQVVDKIKAG